MGGSASMCEVKIMLDQNYYSPGSVARGHVDIILTKDTHIGGNGIKTYFGLNYV